MVKQPFRDFRDKTIMSIKRNYPTAKKVRSSFNDKSNDKDVSVEWLMHRERLKTDAEFLTFFKQHFGEEL